MTGSADLTADLGPVARALADRPEFLAGWVAAAPHAHRWLTDALRLDHQALTRLLLCRAPRPQQFSADVSSIANYIGVDATPLAVALRSVSSLAALSTATPASLPVPAGQRLAAARDIAAELIPSAAPSARIERLATATWAEAPTAVRASRDIEAAISWASPVMMVTLPRLGLASATRWLAERGIPEHLDGDLDQLRGLLVAWRGNGVIFVDGTLDAADRRFTLAHEHGHFLLDYAEPRHRVARDAPALLDVIDGRRAASSGDRAAAALARVPLGLHTHLLHRDAKGGTTAEAGIAEDDASHYALELLAPIDDVVVLLRTELQDRPPHGEALRTAAGLIKRHFGVPAEAASARAAAGLAALDIRPGFFDR